MERYRYAEISLEITAESKDTTVRNYASGERRVGVAVQTP